MPHSKPDVLLRVCVCDSSTQSIINGFQHEQPDYWLTFGNPWEIERPVVCYPISFYGHGGFLSLAFTLSLMAC